MSIFNKIKLSRPKRSVHNLSYPMRMSMGFGDLVPIMCEKIVPGDKFKHSHEFLLRFSPFVSQVYQAFDVRTEYFFVPSRLLWKNFEKFLVEDDSSLYPHPQLSLSDLFDGEHTMENTIVDYIEGVSGRPRYDEHNVFHFDPIDGSQFGFGVDAMPYMALLKIYLDYYADENLFLGKLNNLYYDYQQFCDLFEQAVENNGSYYGTTLKRLYQTFNGLADGYTPDKLFQFFKRSYPKDYFTSALPWAQRGPLVQIPLNGEGDVQVLSSEQGSRTMYRGIGVFDGGANSEAIEHQITLFSTGHLGSNSGATSPMMVDGQASGTRRALSIFSDNGDSQQDQINQVRSDVNNNKITFKAVNINGTATITDLRTAQVVQAWLEKNARAGVRYKEQLASHFGVRSKDYRLDRAELLQSTRSHVSIGEVFTTAQNDDSTFIPGLGVSTATGSAAVKPFKHFFEEHGYLIGFMSLYPKAAYSQGLKRQRLELDKFDYYWPEFQHIGEQEIYNCELFLNDDQPDNALKTFGYTPRYAHYKTRQAEVHGDMLNTLNFMTLSRQFTNAPSLNQSFIDIDPDRNHLYRAFNAVLPFGNAKPVQVDFFHNCKAVRPMSYFGSPRIM